MRAPIPKGKEPVYRKLANVLEELIASRSLRAGDRVPSVRQFSRQQRVSIPTALHAYATLETRGLIEARPKSGFYVRPRQANFLPEPQGAEIPPKITDFAGTDLLEFLLADMTDPKLVSLGAAVPAAELLPGIKLSRMMAAIGRRLGATCVDYDMAPGSEILRRELARRSLEWGCALKADDFLVTVGATEAVSLALRATCEPGDTVIVESPTYFGFARMLREMRLNALPVPVDSAKGINPDILQKALRKKRIAACLLIPNFHNPVGCLMPESAKKQVVALLAKRGIPLIEDDIYGDMQHQGPRPRCLKAFDTDGSVILCGSYSKSLAPGFRVGYAAAGRWHSRLVALKRVTTLCSPTLPTRAVAEFLKNGGYDRYLRSIRQTFRYQVEQMREAVAENFPKGVRLSRPQGGFLLWCELPRKVDALALFRQARTVGISIAPGPMFSADEGFRNFIRLNCGRPWDARTETALRVLGRLVRQMAGK